MGVVKRQSLVGIIFLILGILGIKMVLFSPSTLTNVPFIIVALTPMISGIFILVGISFLGNALYNWTTNE